MKWILAGVVAFVVNCAFAQSDFNNPAQLTVGENLLPVSGIRATGFYTFQAKTDCLVTLTLPSGDAQVFLSSTPEENPTYSTLPVMVRKYPEEERQRARFAVNAGETRYLKISFISWELPEGGTYTFTMAWKSICLTGGETPATAQQPGLEEDFYLPLTIGTDDLLLPSYFSLTTPQYGYLYLDFEPSITQLKYRNGEEGEFKTLRHTYLSDNGQVYGAQAILEITPGEDLTFEATGFTPAVGRLKVVDPEPGTLCEFPIDIEPGVFSIPAEEGEWYFRIKPTEEGYIQIDSPWSLPGGYVEVMMDCNGFGGFKINGELSLRCFVWDNMEYLIHISKVEPTAKDTPFTVSINPPLDCDSFDTAALVTPGEEISTPPYAGTYFYRVQAPDLIGSQLQLHTLTVPGDSRTRANLFAADNDTDTLARGLQMEYEVERDAEYVVQYTVFDNRLPLLFSISFEGGESGVESLSTAWEKPSSYTLQGVPARETDGGKIIIREGKTILKTK